MSSDRIAADKRKRVTCELSRGDAFELNYCQSGKQTKDDVTTSD
jgi:hypothetical protein